MWGFLPLILLGILLLYSLSFLSVQAPRVFIKKGCPLHRRSRKHLSFLSQIYRPPLWLRSGTFMTVVRAVFQSGPSLPWKGELVTLPDEGIIALDWLHPDGVKEDSTILLIFPGITGHTHKASYLWNAAKEAAEKGWRVVVVNRRGLGVPLRTARCGGAANNEDMTFILEKFVQSRYPKAKKVGLGFSMGGMVLINYLSTRKKENAIIDYGMSVSSPFDSHATSRSLSGFFSKTFLNRAIAMNLIASVQPYKKLLENHINWDFMMESKEIGIFERWCTVPLGGYKDLNHYYVETSPRYKIEKIPVPFLVLCSDDDYFVPTDWMPLKKFEQSENVMCVVTTHGGHTAYMEESDPNARGFVERALFEWAEMHLEDRQ